MIIWRGLGILVPFATLICTIGVHVAGQAITGYGEEFGANPLLTALSMVLSGLACFVISHIISKVKPPRVYIDPETGERVLFKEKHSLFFIDIKYWGFILPIIGLITIFTK